MSFLARFESFMERLIETSLRRLLKKPLDTDFLLRRLERVMEANQMVVDGNINVPHIYRIFLHPRDYANFEANMLGHELVIVNYLQELAQTRHFVVAHPIRVKLAKRSYVPLSDIFVETEHDIDDAIEDTSDLPALNTNPHEPSTMHSDTANHNDDVGHAHRNSNARYMIEISSPEENTQQAAITTTQITFGRAPGNNVLLNDHQVSRYHAKITFNARRFQITDLASRNGTFINGERLTNQSYELDIDNDMITISHYTIRIKPIRAGTK
ncbi:MAG: FhaA domain-containing protein [Roseiflexaceae bacterium]